MTLLDTALYLTQQGYCVIPTRADGSKAPMGEWEKWQHERPNTDAVQAWLDSGRYDGIGLICGAVSGNLEMIELEGRAIAEGISVKMAEIAEASGLAHLWARIVTGYSETSPSGGIHFLYRVNGPVAGNTKLARRPSTPAELAEWKITERTKAEQLENETQRQKRLERIEQTTPEQVPQVLVETRGEGGYVVIAPSNGRTHPSGKPWTILAGGIDTIPTLTTDERDALHILARAVDQMPTAASEQPPKQEDRHSDGPNVADDYNQRTTWDDLLIPEGWTKVYTAGTTTYWRRPGKTQGISATTGRNDGDNLYVFSSSTTFDTERPYSRFAAYAHLEHNDDYSTAAKKLYADGYGQRATRIDDIIDLPVHGPEQQPAEAERQIHDHEADLANARWLVHMHGDRMRYVVPWKKWLIWDGKRWTVDQTGEAVRLAKSVADTLPKKNGKRPARAQTKHGITYMLDLASTEPTIAVAPSHLDADPHLLNVQNGTIDLRTRELRPHDPTDLITKITGAAYHPDAATPEFTKFLERVQPDENMRDFLARLFGHALLGKVVEHVLPVLYGTGANGKSTLAECIARVLGDYADTADPGLLIDRGETHPTGIADLFGLRLAITHETDEGRRLAEGTVKRLTGGDKVKARRMREDFWSFDPSHSLIMLTNHKPIVRGTDEGIWRRLRFVPFNVVIPENERDSKLPERLASELDGILAWIVNGYRQWQDRGLAEPSQVAEATKAFRGESDMLMAFLEERCRLDAGPYATVQSSELFSTWVTWCKKENVEAGTQTAFSRQMVDRGFDKKKDGAGRMVWSGIGLYADEVDT